MGGKEATEDEGNLDTTRCERSIWLTKVPVFVGETWKKIVPGESSSGSIGTLRAVLDPLKTGLQSYNELSFRMNESFSNLPNQYTWTSASDPIPMEIFSEAPNGKFSLEGFVENKFDMQPKISDASYRELVKNRDKKFNTPRRTLKLLSDNMPGGVGPMLPMPGDTLVAFRKKGEKPMVPAKPSDTKRVRMDKDALLAKLFELFEVKPHYPLKDLMMHTNQPQAFLKDILQELCIYNKRGPNQGMYELKPEYKRSTVEPPDAKPSL